MKTGKKKQEKRKRRKSRLEVVRVFTESLMPVSMLQKLSMRAFCGFVPFWHHGELGFVLNFSMVTEWGGNV